MGEHEAAERREGAAEGEEHALEAGKHAFAPGGMLGDEHAGGFA